MSQKLNSALNKLSMKQIIAATGDEKLNRAEKRKRSDLVDTIQHIPDAHSSIIIVAENDASHLDNPRSLPINVENAFEQLTVKEIQSAVLEFKLSYAEKRTRSTLLECIRHSSALQSAVLLAKETKHKDVLKLYVSHHSQCLVDGMLLYNASIKTQENYQHGFFCDSCLDDIKSNKTPVQSLANNLWVGDILDELAMLILPERILVALSYPAAYIVKLYPKKCGAIHWDVAGLNSGLRGNVSTYRLNTSAITAMVQGNLLPPKPSVLATTIGVSIVGPNNFPKRCLPAFLSVSRCHLRNALLFLKRENPLYRNIVISEENIALFPEHGIRDVIISSVRHLQDVAAVDKQNKAFPTGQQAVEDIVIDETVPSNVFPIQSHGVLDSNVSEVDDEQILALALANLSEQYSVQCGNTFVNEYPRRNIDHTLSIGDPDNPNHLLGAFPCLFPYGAGGFEVQRPHQLSYEAHAQWAMRYADRRFCKDLHFMFQVFGVIQKRQVCRQAVLQVKKDDFHRNEHLFHSLTVTDLQKASEEEQQHRTCSNSTIRSLKKHLTAVQSKVMGTDESRTKIRSLIWGMSVMKNPPSLWITINPTDTHDPIAQVFTGAEIDLDHFQHLAGPDSHT
ncbi:hypothetical protein EV702DRAFT_1198218 [Suillus placidus]|uniref:Helitron helicase-like domain-containing protein n=1 Tax=Suillus placidus TaxID=48579 RepID=A0A9P7D2Y2_9AGAM|nr:hypothetical protein EV702DRAFT_1198218 [Suillus placidus]